ncbi:GNAT family N-acetyltransferase [Streptomyces sodiiphilus]|uniref:GNAT family N-acetyltransferase n=1 Tax=Streptomyces sodiiphilus TaxID=226217 RepID=A0ABN2NSM8_9ACTN
MTTTLRPDGPEERTADGTRTRTFTICDNARPVGTLRLSADSGPGGTAGRIEELSVEEPDRRRGRATVAALAAEEVLRDWGCRHLGVSVPADAGGATRLAGLLGYAADGRMMSKEVPGHTPPPPPGSTLEDMSPARYPGWLEAEKAGFVRTCTGRGLSSARAGAIADETHRRHLPDGPDSEGSAVRVLMHEGNDVGTLWVSTGEGLPLPTEGFVFSVEVAAAHRGRGHGRTLMYEAERVCRAAGARTLGLHVVEGNAAARALYRSLGYRTVTRSFHKLL